MRLYIEISRNFKSELKTSQDVSSNIKPVCITLTVWALYSEMLNWHNRYVKWPSEGIHTSYFDVVCRLRKHTKHYQLLNQTNKTDIIKDCLTLLILKLTRRENITTKLLKWKRCLAHANASTFVYLVNCLVMYVLIGAYDYDVWSMSCHKLCVQVLWQVMLS